MRWGRDARGRRGKLNLNGRSKAESSITGHEGGADNDPFARRAPLTLMRAGRRFKLWVRCGP
jgi:hypothetical protein